VGHRICLGRMEGQADALEGSKGEGRVPGCLSIPSAPLPFPSLDAFRFLPALRPPGDGFLTAVWLQAELLT
jgi:hypothetical protein